MYSLYILYFLQIILCSVLIKLGLNGSRHIYIFHSDFGIFGGGGESPLKINKHPRQDKTKGNSPTQLRLGNTQLKKMKDGTVQDMWDSFPINNKSLKALHIE